MLNFIRWDRESLWEKAFGKKALDWMETVSEVMLQYTEAVDGSYFEGKESALVWHYQNADPYFGSCQAQELFQYIQNILVNEATDMTRGGHNIAEVDPQVQF